MSLNAPHIHRLGRPGLQEHQFLGIDMVPKEDGGPSVVRDGIEVGLTPAEFVIVDSLAEEAGFTLPNAVLYDRDISPNSLRSQKHRLADKLSTISLGVAAAHRFGNRLFDFDQGDSSPEVLDPDSQHPALLERMAGMPRGVVDDHSRLYVDKLPIDFSYRISRFVSCMLRNADHPIDHEELLAFFEMKKKTSTYNTNIYAAISTLKRGTKRFQFSNSCGTMTITDMGAAQKTPQGLQPQ